MFAVSRLEDWQLRPCLAFCPANYLFRLMPVSGKQLTIVHGAIEMLFFALNSHINLSNVVFLLLADEECTR